MFKHILVPVDLADIDLAKSSLETAVRSRAPRAETCACSMWCR